MIWNNTFVKLTILVDSHLLQVQVKCHCKCKFSFRYWVGRSKLVYVMVTSSPSAISTWLNKLKKLDNWLIIEIYKTILFEVSVFRKIPIIGIYLIFFSVVFGSITCFALFTHECDKKEKNGYKIRPFLLS